MTNSKKLFNDFVSKINLPDREEASAAAFLIFEKMFKLSKTNILAQEMVEVSNIQERGLDSMIERLNRYEPVQYILGESFFVGRLFNVNSGVLIPRPETEEMVGTVIQLSKSMRRPLTVLDIGTGSGCIAITLALEIPDAEVHASDISNQALETARGNAAKLGADVSFIFHNILRQELPLQAWDIIVSNPPYIAESEKSSMNKNVLQYEPELALFVPNDEALIYYEAIAKKATKALKQGGLVCVEINEAYGQAVKDLFTSVGFSDTKILKDLSGKDRIVLGWKK